MYLNVYQPSRLGGFNGYPLAGFLDRVFGDVASPAASGAAPAVVTRQARFDVVEKGDRFEASVELPGVTKDDIEVSIDGAWVSIKAKTQGEEVKKEGERTLYTERFAGQIARTFELPSEVSEERAEASYQDGVLKLVLPKKEAAQAKRLLIK